MKASTKFVGVIVCLALALCTLLFAFAVGMMIKCGRDNPFVYGMTLSDNNSFISGTIISSEGYDAGYIVKIRVNSVFTTETYVNGEYSVTPKAELYVYTSDRRLNEKVGESGLFLLRKTSSVSKLKLPDYVQRMIKSNDDTLWFDKSNGEVIYDSDLGMGALDTLCNNGIELTEQSVSTAIMDVYQSYTHYSILMIIALIFSFVLFCGTICCSSSDDYY